MTETLDLAPRSISRYGWKPSLPDTRDHIADTSGIKALPEVDPRPNMPGVYDQLQLGSCTANAIAAALQYDAILDGSDDFKTPSRLAIYWLERFLEGGLANTQQDTGAFGRDGFKVAQKIGFAPETDWPYLEAKFRDDPREHLAADFAKHKLAKPYRAVPRYLSSFKAALSNQQTIAFGFTVYESFESDEVKRTGLMPVPEQGERQLGGHEVLMVGYLKSEPGYMLCRNSWNTDWGIGGYFLMPVAVLLDKSMSSDFRTIARVL